jgi:hypothetical protein
MPPWRLHDVFKNVTITSDNLVMVASPWHHDNALKTIWKRLEKQFQGVFKTFLLCLQNVFKIPSNWFNNALKTFLLCLQIGSIMPWKRFYYAFKTFSGYLQIGSIMPWKRFYDGFNTSLERFLFAMKMSLLCNKIVFGMFYYAFITL